MKKSIILVIGILLILQGAVFAEVTKVGTTAANFLNIEAGARANFHVLEPCRDSALGEDRRGL